MSLFTLLLGVYLLLLALLCMHGSLKVRSSADFWIAGGRASAVSTGGSLVATIIGGSSTLGLAALAFERGLSGSWWLLVGPVGLAGLLLFLKGLKRRSVYTLPQLIRCWYGPLVGRVAGLLILVAWLGIVGAQAAAAGRILTAFLGGDPRLWTLAAGAVFITYTASGGQVSVIRTDLLQALLIIGGIGLCALFGFKAAGGLTGLSAALPPGHFSFPLSAGFSGLDLALMLLVVGSTYLVGPDMLSRVFSARDAVSARRAILLSICVIVPAALLVTSAGMVARALYPHIPAEASLPTLARQALPPWMSAVTMIALLSAFVSSADTTLLTMSAILTVDILGMENPPALIGPRLAVLGCGLAALLVGIYSGGIIPSLLLGYSVFAGGLFIPILAGLMGQPLRRPLALSTAVLGGLCALAGKLCGLAAMRLASDLLVAGSFAVGAGLFAADRILSYSGKR